MSRDGSGIYSVPVGTQAVTGQPISSTDYNAFLADLEADLNLARPLTAGGTGATSASAARTALGIAIGTNVQAFDQQLTDIAALAVTDGGFIVGNGTTFVLETAGTVRASLGFPSSTTDNTVPRFNGTTGAMQTSGITIDDNDFITGGVTNGTAVSASSTAVGFTGIPSGAKRITLSWAGLSTNGTDALLIQLGDSGGYETSGYLGAGAYVPDGASPAVANRTDGFLVNLTGAAANVSHGSITFTLVGSNTWAASGVFAASNGAATMSVAGSKATSATLDRVRVTTTGGTNTFDAGTVNISYSG